LTSSVAVLILILPAAGALLAATLKKGVRVFSALIAASVTVLAV
jgi:hypothetical protein